jgi:DNA polymerase-3 subunit beta
MHVVINRNALVEVLNVASGIAGSRTTKEVLRCVRLTTIDGGLAVGATDLEVGLRGVIQQVETKAEGDTLVPADKLMQIARESSDETLTLETDEQACHVRGQDSHFEVYTYDVKDFPPIPEPDGDPDLEIDAQLLDALISRTLFAVAKENTRYAINGVLWEKQGKKLSLVATDGRRLAQAQGAAKKAVGDDQRMIVPAKTMSVLQRILAHEEGVVGVSFSSNQVLLKVGTYEVSSALVEGHFPQYEDVIPKDSDRSVELSTSELLSAVRRSALLTNEQSKGVRLSFDENMLVISSRAPEQGEATVSMRIEYSYSPMHVGFNPVFLSDALRVAGTPTVSLELKEANRPGVIKNGEGFLYVVMPVNLA